MPHTAVDKRNDKNKDWFTIMRLGLYAPTPHNTQWYFIRPLNNTTATVCIDASIALPHTDPDDQFRFTGLGVFVRHLELAAEATGFTLGSEFNTLDPESPVTVRIIATKPANASLAGLIQKRQTSRLAYRKEKISADAIEAITSLSNAANKVDISSNAHIVQSVLNLNNKVLLDDLQNKGIGDELNHWIRYTRSSQTKYLSGFTPSTLAVPAWKIYLVFHARKVMLIGPMRRWLTRQYFMQNMTTMVGWLYGPLRTRQNQYEAGKFMMDIWMKITELGYYMQPYGSIITNHKARKIFLQDIGQEEADGNMVWLAFRIGKSKRPAVSPRKSIQEYIR